MAGAVSLGVIATAFVPVAILFIAAGALAGRWEGEGTGLGAGVSRNGGGVAPRPWGTLARAVWLPATAEALVLTLFAALWFGSLGHGGWWLVFLLVGALAAGADRWTRRRLAGAPPAHELRWIASGLLKYLAAGLVCAWRLS
jgi:hypothetical protein